MSRAFYQTPTPEAVARLVASHGFDAAVSRWGHATDSRSLAALARTGRAKAGQRPLSERPRRTPSTVDLAALETACAIGSLSAGVRVSGINESSLCSVFTGRGLSWPRQSSADRGVTSRDVAKARKGDVAAAARIEARKAHELAVYAVVKAALALAPEQPPTGRPLMPEPSPELRDVLAGCEPAAVEAVFPGLLQKFQPSVNGSVN